MDPSVIAAMASSVLASYLTKGGEAFASEFGPLLAVAAPLTPRPRGTN